MTVRQQIYRDLVAAGMDRAYRAASYVEKLYPTWTFEVLLDDVDSQGEGSLDEANPLHLPTVWFIATEEVDGKCTNAGDTKLLLHRSEQCMIQTLRQIADPKTVQMEIKRAVAIDSALYAN